MSIFEYEDPSSTKIQEKLPLGLKVSENSTLDLLLILRLLNGTLKVTRSHDNAFVKQRDSYFDPNNQKYNLHNWQHKFPAIFGEQNTASDLNDFLLCSTTRQNKKFYENFLYELSSFFIHKKQKSHTAAFIHLYRSLEYISYAFPMIYASRANDFAKTFT